MNFAGQDFPKLFYGVPQRVKVTFAKTEPWGLRDAETQNVRVPVETTI